MNAKSEYEFKKLNDLLCNSFNNVKYDVRDLNGKLENLKTNFANFSTESIKTAFEYQTKLLSEQQSAINHLSERLSELESRPVQNVVREMPHSMVMSRSSGFVDDLKEEKTVKSTKKTSKKQEPSIYDIPEGEVRITKVQFKAKGKTKGNKRLNEEWIEITGYGVDLIGHKLYDKGRKHTFKFPEGFVIYGPIKVFTGKGRNTNTRLYWGNPRPIWNDTGDVATLCNKRGKVLSQVLSEPTYSFKTLK